MCSANKHLIGPCVQGAQNTEINQKEAWVEGEVLETEAEVCDAGLFLCTWKI